MAEIATRFTLHADIMDFMESDDEPIDGLEVYFDVNITRGEFLAFDAEPRPTLIRPSRVTGYIHSDGRMYDAASGGNLGVRLIAHSEDLLMIDSDLQYQVSTNRMVLSNGRNWKAIPWYFNAPKTDSVNYLAELARSPSTSAVGVSRGPQGYSVIDVGLDEDGKVQFSNELGPIGEGLDLVVTEAGSIDGGTPWGVDEYEIDGGTP